MRIIHLHAEETPREAGVEPDGFARLTAGQRVSGGVAYRTDPSAAGPAPADVGHLNY